MYPILKTSTGLVIDDLEQTIIAPVEKDLYGKWICEAEIVKSDKTNNIVNGTLLEIDGQDFIITSKQSVISENGLKTVKLKGEHISYKGNSVSYALVTYAFTGTAEEILTDLITTTGAPFTVGTIPSTGSAAFTINELTSFRAMVAQIGVIFSLEVDYDNLEINMYTQIGINDGAEFTTGSNLISADSYEDFKNNELSLKVDVAAIKESEEYKKGEIQFEYDFNLGDIVRTIVLDKDDSGNDIVAIDETTRIVKIKRDSIKPKRPTYTLSSELRTYTGQYTSEKFRLIVKDRSVYGIKFSSNDGQVIERTDQLARAKFNADELRFQTGDGTGNYTDAIYFDILTNKYKIVGDIEVSGTITVGAGSSGITNFGDAGGLVTKDSVDMSTSEVINKIADNIQETISRKWAAESGADVTGNNTAQNIFGQGALATRDNISLSFVTDSGILAGLDTISEVYIDNDSITAPKIAANAVIASKIAAGAVVADKIAVGQLSAITADLGSITAGSLDAVNISASTYTTTGVFSEKLEILGGASDINWRNSSNVLIAQISGPYSASADMNISTAADLILTAGGSYSGELQGGTWYYRDGSADERILTRGTANGLYNGTFGITQVVNLATASTLSFINGVCIATS